MPVRVINNSIVERELEILGDHFHSSQKCKPTLANSIVLTGGVPAWTLGTKVEIFAANEIASPFDIHYIGVGAVSAVDVYEIKLFSGLAGAEVEISTTRTYRQSVQSSAAQMPIIMPIQPAGTRITASVATGTGGADTIGIAVFYHTY